MTKVLLHVGTGKTGTSSIQRSLQRAADHDHLVGVSYPATRATNHNELAAVYKPSDRLPRITANKQRRNPQGFARRVNGFRQELFDALATGGDAIVSAEYLAGFEVEQAEAFRQDLAAAGVNEIRVVLYVREPASYYLSYVQQRLKASHQFSPPRRFAYQFSKALKTWRTIDPDLVVRPFVRDQLHEQNVVADLLREAARFFGHAVATDDFEYLGANESISAEGMVLLQRYRSRYYSDRPDVPEPDSSELLRFVEKSKSEIDDQTRPRLRPEIAWEVTRRHERELAELADVFGVDLRPKQTAEEMASPELMASTDVTQILAEHDEQVVDELLHFCLREALLASCRSRRRRRQVPASQATTTPSPGERDVASKEG